MVGAESAREEQSGIFESTGCLVLVVKTHGYAVVDAHLTSAAGEVKRGFLACVPALAFLFGLPLAWKAVPQANRRGTVNRPKRYRQQTRISRGMFTHNVGN